MTGSINEQAVWERVTGGNPNVDSSPRRSPVAPELLDILEENRALIRSYQVLAARLGSQSRSQIQTVIRQKQQSHRTLSGLYAFLTGSPPDRRQASADSSPNAPAALLRQLMRREERLSGQLEALSARTSGEPRQALMELSREVGPLFRQLLPLLGQLTGGGVRSSDP